MTTELLFIIATMLTAFVTAGLIAWLRRPRHRPVLTGAHGAPIDDMFAYTMYDDPC
jgi:hypothetical protein